MQFCNLEADVKAPIPYGRVPLAVGDKELDSTLPVGEAAEFMVHVVSKL